MSCTLSSAAAAVSRPGPPCSRRRLMSPSTRAVTAGVDAAADADGRRGWSSPTLSLSSSRSSVSVGEMSPHE